MLLFLRPGTRRILTLAINTILIGDVSPPCYRVLIFHARAEGPKHDDEVTGLTTDIVRFSGTTVKNREQAVVSSDNRLTLLLRPSVLCSTYFPGSRVIAANRDFARSFDRSRIFHANQTRYACRFARKTFTRTEFVWLAKTSSTILPVLRCGYLFKALTGGTLDETFAVNEKRGRRFSSSAL